jgi:hypothetical protein
LPACAGGAPRPGDDPELALSAAINVLGNGIEAGRMPSGIELEAMGRAIHEAAIAAFERLIAWASAEYSTLPATLLAHGPDAHTRQA